MIYRNFALIYDELMNHAPYDEWASFTIDIIKQFKLDVNTMIDLGCGTGEITNRLAKHGFNMYGIDMSTEMLSVAMTKSTEKQLQVQWINQDIRQLTGFNEIDLALSYCDVFNYLTTEEDLLMSFQNIYNSLRDGGLFLFDVHGLNYARTELMNQSFSSRDDELPYIWDCESGEHDGQLLHYLSFFVKNENNSYERFDEIHEQQVYPLDTYIKLLEKAQFTNLHFYRDFSLEMEFCEEKAERIFILAEKRAEH